MKEICVITGGGSGIGLSAAKYMPKEKTIVLSGRTASKLERAVNELKTLGYEAYFKTCDTSDRESVSSLAYFAAAMGTVKTVIHAAGLSPAMADAETLIRVNALGTVYINNEFAKVMKNGGVIIDISSNSAYAIPKIMTGKRLYSLADTNEKLFLKKMLKRSSIPRNEYEKSGLAYALSKNFAVWYAGKCAFDFAGKGIRVASLSPGLIATDMGNLEAEEGSRMLSYGTEHRMGKPEELGFAVASLADERNSYLSGVDIICDGGCTTGKKVYRRAM